MSDDAPPPPSLTEFQDRASRNPFRGEQAVAVVGALANVEQHRGIAEVQARMIIARANPRDPQRCMDAILRDCTRPSLAEKALYQYARGGTSISGPSIRLAEAIAQRWGNIASGIKEVSRSKGYSECIAYAWDLETGFYDERQYQVRHWRDTKQGGHPITDEREIYEHVANLGARRKRAALLTVIPGDVIEAAEEQCEETLRADVDLSPAALKRLVDAFGAHGVTQAQIEKRCQCRLAAIRPAQVVQLRKIYASLKDEMSEPKDWFETNAWTEVAEQHAETRRQQSVDQSASQQKPKPTAKRQQAEKKTEQAEATRDAEAPRGVDVPHDTSGTDGLGPTAGGSPAPAEITTVPTFEEWLLDENGEPIGEEPFTDPMLFVGRLEVIWQVAPDVRENLMQENASGLEAAASMSEKAAGIIDSMRNAAPAMEDAADDVAPAAVLLLARTTDGQYLKDFRPAVTATTADNYLDFIAANQETMLTTAMSTRSLLLKALIEQADKLGVPRPAGLAEMMQPKPQQKPASEQDPELARDARAVEDRIAEMQACKTDHELMAMGRGVILKNFGERLTREGKSELKQKLDDAYRAKMETLSL